jgi:GNAT superfamily N-acetyltransferase
MTSNHGEHTTGVTEITIRPMNEADITPYCALFENVFSRPPWNEHWTQPQISAIISRQIRKKGFFGLAATMSCGTIGFLTGFRVLPVTSLFYIDQLFVSTGYQGLKTGKKLLTQAELELRQQGVFRTMLLTKPGSFAETFYRKNGYAPLVRLFRFRGKALYSKHLQG